MNQFFPHSQHNEQYLFGACYWLYRLATVLKIKSLFLQMVTYMLNSMYLSTPAEDCGLLKCVKLSARLNVCGIGALIPCKFIYTGDLFVSSGS